MMTKVVVNTAILLWWASGMSSLLFGITGAFVFPIAQTAGVGGHCWRHALSRQGTMFQLHSSLQQLEDTLNEQEDPKNEQEDPKFFFPPPLPKTDDVEEPQRMMMQQQQQQQVLEDSSSGNSNSSGKQSPAEIENVKFDCDKTVELWKNFQMDGFQSTSQNIQNFIPIVTKFVSSSQDSFDYWVRHSGRTLYCGTNALLGNYGFRLYEAFIRQEDNASSPFDYVLNQPSVTSRILLECAMCYEQDYEQIRRGQYKKPYDMYSYTRQASPFYAGRQTIRFVREAIGTLGRRKSGTEQDKRIWMTTQDTTTSSLYPKYYQTAFHYQTDGWMSQESANVYETSTEALFLGRQDAMQRTALPPLISYSKEINTSSPPPSSSGVSSRVLQPMKVLEIACGTGRFMTFARDNLPLNTEYTAIDLSPFYLNAARDNDSNWRKVRLRQEKKRKTTSSSSGSPSSVSTSIPPARLVQAKAEDLPFHDQEFDAVVCIYLFHELPRPIRAQVAKEMARVVKPGGRIILTDSTQLGDRPAFDDDMSTFEKMNEPFYCDYIQDELPLHFETVGLQCLTKTVCASTKTLSFRKPAPTEP